MEKFTHLGDVPASTINSYRQKIEYLKHLLMERNSEDKNDLNVAFRTLRFEIEDDLRFSRTQKQLYSSEFDKDQCGLQQIQERLSLLLSIFPRNSRPGSRQIRHCLEQMETQLRIAY